MQVEYPPKNSKTSKIMFMRHNTLLMMHPYFNLSIPGASEGHRERYPVPLLPSQSAPLSASGVCFTTGRMHCILVINR